MAIWVAPGAPMTMCGRSPSNTMDGTTELKRALPGARLPARPGRGSNTPMQPLYMKPSPAVTTPDGMPSEWVMVTQLPSASTHRDVGGVLARRAARVEARHVGLLPGADLLGELGRVVPCRSSRSTGTSTKRGSPT